MRFRDSILIVPRKKPFFNRFSDISRNFAISQNKRLKFIMSRENIATFFAIIFGGLAALYGYWSQSRIEAVQTENSKLESELRRVKRRKKGQNKCSVCLYNPLEIRCHPCGHVCLCQECSTKLNKCPICRAVIQDFQRTFI